MGYLYIFYVCTTYVIIKGEVVDISRGDVSGFQMAELKVERDSNLMES